MTHGAIVTEQVLTCSPTVVNNGAGQSDPSGPPPGVGLASCTGAALVFEVDPAEFCPEDSAPTQPVVTPGLVAQALARLALPASPLQVQPPDGRTLVNFRTNFFTEERVLHRTVRLLGQRVELRIEPQSYTWHFGDGESVTTEQPGAPYPRLQVTHSYLRTGEYGPSVDTTWVADFRVDGGAWRPVPGSVTIAGEPVALEAIEARPTLVGYGG